MRRIFAAAPVDDKLIVLAVARLGRVREIQRVLIQQIAILETMTASSFLEFRDFLVRWRARAGGRGRARHALPPAFLRAFARVCTRTQTHSCPRPHRPQRNPLPRLYRSTRRAASRACNSDLSRIGWACAPTRASPTGSAATAPTCRTAARSRTRRRCARASARPRSLTSSRPGSSARRSSASTRTRRRLRAWTPARASARARARARLTRRRASPRRRAGLGGRTTAPR